MKFKLESYSDTTDYFSARDDDGNTYNIDIWLDGNLEAPDEALTTRDNFYKWLKSLVGKTIICDNISPLYYTTTGKIKVIN